MTAHRRGAPVAATVLDATLALLADRGWDFSVDEVAAVAGVHKTTVYRRWPTKAALVAAALGQLDERPAPAATADPLADLEVLAVQVAAALRRPAVTNALRAALTAGGLPSSTAALVAGHPAAAAAVLDRARAAGLVREDLDPRLTWQAIVGPLHLDALLGGPPGDDTARALVRLVLDGPRPPG